MVYKLKVVVTACNVKKIDLKAYDIDKARCYVIVKVNDKEVKTTEKAGLDPEWEEEFEFDVNDPETDKCSAKFFMGSEGGKQIGDEQFYILNLLIKGRPTYKALIVPGGKVDLMVTAVDFGSEKEPEVDSSFMDALDGDMDMCADSSDDDE